jgi:Undecaprenyl-phosphate galactose phosphotransferase WbaP
MSLPNTAAAPAVSGSGSAAVRHARWAPRVFYLSDLLAVLLTLWASMHLTDRILLDLQGFDEFGLPWEAMSRRAGELLILACLLGLWLRHKGHYAVRLPAWIEAKQLLMGTAAAALLDGYLQFALKNQPSALWHLLSWALAFVLVLLLRSLARCGLDAFGLWQLPTLLIASNATAPHIREVLESQSSLGYAVVHTLPLDDAATADAVTAKLRHALANRSVGYVVIAWEAAHMVPALQAIEHLEGHSEIPHGLVPPLRGLSIVDLELCKIFGHDVVVLDNSRRSRTRLRLAMKRGFDIVGSLLLIGVFAVPMITIALLVRSDGAPALYGSIRLGRAGRPFKAWKFRTMVPDAGRVLAELLAREPARRIEWEAQFKLKDDPRITPLGRSLRRSSLDELPQLFNVLRGEMSLVGPRPVLPDERKTYGADFSLYSQATPGMTGAWQVSGRDELDYRKRIELNNWYIRNWSPWSDTFILAKTLAVVLRKAGAS